MKPTQLDETEKIARGERLRHLRNLANISRADMEEKFGIKAVTLKSWELGVASGLTDRGARQLITIFQKLGIQCSIGWLMRNTGRPPHFDEFAQLPKQKKSDDTVLSEILYFCEHHPNAIYAPITDDGMEPFYSIGDYVAGERHYQTAISDTLGHPCIVETQMGDVLVRYLRKGSQPNRYSLLCLNAKTAQEPYLQDVELLSSAPILLHRRIIKS